MSERYDLIFRGELQDGADSAAVRRALAQVLKLGGEQIEQLFSGRAVTLRRGVDKPTAARFQQAFRLAGARLRVTPAAEEPLATDSPPIPAATVSPTPPRTLVTAAATVRPAPPLPRKQTLAERLAAQAVGQKVVRPKAQPDEPTPQRPGFGAPAGSGDGLFSIAPAGVDVLRPEDRVAVPAREIDTAHLTMTAAGKGSFADHLPPLPPPPPPPDTSALSLDAPGVDLSLPAAVEALEIDIPDFALAPPGAVLAPPRPEVAREIDTSSLSIAPPGVPLGVPKAEVPPAAPDVSHLELQHERARFDG